MQRACPECCLETHRMTEQAFREEKLARKLSRLADSGISGRHIDMTLDAFWDHEQPEAHAAAMDFIAAYPMAPNMILTGPHGTGKTHLLIGICQEVTAGGVFARYVDWLQVQKSLNAADDRARMERLLLEPLLTVPVLALDEVGREINSPTMALWMDNLINLRWRDRLPTLMATNLTEADLIEHWLSSAAASRLQEHCIVASTTGRDARKAAVNRRPVPQRPEHAEPCLACHDSGWVMYDYQGKQSLSRCPVCGGRDA